MCHLACNDTIVWRIAFNTMHNDPVLVLLQAQPAAEDQPPDLKATAAGLKQKMLKGVDACHVRTHPFGPFDMVLTSTWIASCLLVPKHS